MISDDYQFQHPTQRDSHILYRHVGLLINNLRHSITQRQMLSIIIFPALIEIIDKLLMITDLMSLDE